MWRSTVFCALTALCFVWSGALSAAESVLIPTLHSSIESIQVEPSTIELKGSRARQGIVVTAQLKDGSSVDVTPFARVEIEPEGIATFVNECFVPNSDGEGEVRVRVAHLDTSLPIKVLEADTRSPIEFRNEALQILTKAGCNSGKCHGAASGKDGFHLSLFGYDPQGDHFRLTQEISGRRISLIRPESSLLLLKGTGEVPHTGGTCFDQDSEFYDLLRQWIREGSTLNRPQDPLPTGIEVFPSQAVFANPSGQQKLVVVATFSDGSKRDVTRFSVFLSNNDAAATVDEEGMVSATGQGSSFVLARFDQFTQGASIVVRPGTPFQSPDRPQFGAIDRYVDRRLDHLHLAPSPIATDEQFLRRVTIDLTGRLPTLSEYKTFVADKDDQKRARLIDELLKDPAFDDLWVMRWAELLQIRTSNGISPKALKLYDEWLRSAVHQGERIDSIVKQVLHSNGGTLENPATNYYQTETTPQLVAENVAQVFLGTRIQCAQCHNHPFDRWTMDDYYGFASFFSQVGYKQAKDPRELTVFNQGKGEIEHLIRDRKVLPKFLDKDAPAKVEGRDYREVLAEWLASHENGAFRNNIANIVWSHYFGIGIVEPVDDFRASNPPSNLPLLSYLGDRLVEVDFDIRELSREICNSRSYQTSTQRNDSNRLDEREFSHQKIRRLRAEVLLDCLSQVTESEEKLPGLSNGSKAVQIADGAASHYFLSTFGRSSRTSPCTCEVKTSPTLSQALHLLNGETTSGKIQQGNVIGKFLLSGDSPLEVAKNLFRSCYSRECTEEELKEIADRLKTSSDMESEIEDLFWAILNSNEFIFNH